MKTLNFVLFACALACLSGCNKEKTIGSQQSALLSQHRTVVLPITPPVNYNISITRTVASSSSAGWPTSSAADNNLSTLWSSRTAGSNHTEWFAFYFGGFNNINYVKLSPRYAGNNGILSFPVNFSIYYSNGTQWVLCASYNHFPATADGLPITLALPSTVNANGIEILATQLGKDDVNNYVFQLAEVGAGDDPGFNHLSFVTNDGTSQVNKITNTGSCSFNPAKITNLTPDDRDPFIAAKNQYAIGVQRNIYAPSIVYNGGAVWNVYFGGWDASSSQNDEISVTVSLDNFNTFNPHSLLIHNNTNLGIAHVNNASVMKRPDGSFLMYFTNSTSGPSGPDHLNKPAYTISPDGVNNWTTSYADTANFLKMNNYPNWANANANGSNVGYLDNNGIYHLYFLDYNNTLLVHHATSPDAVNFTYVGDVNSTDSIICTDMKSFTYNSGNYYLMGAHRNRSSVYYSISTNLNAFPQSQTYFTNLNATDLYITSVGFVTGNNRLYGVLYGAGPSSALNQNSIHARWLTKKVIFISDASGARWGDIEKAHGPNETILYMNSNIATGRFYVYDTDGTTLLYTSPEVTMKSGDVWNYVN